MAKGKKRARPASEKQRGEEIEEALPSKVYRSSDAPLRKEKWTNKQRVLIFASRGINYRSRHLMINLREMLPHSKPDSKMSKKDSLASINDICEMKNCNKCIYFEQRKGNDLYVWISNVPNGPSAKFLVQNVHTLEELKLTGNCLKGSRPILSFDETFQAQPEYRLLQELFVQVFGTPNHHPKSQPFIDHVLTFKILDRKIWFRNYQIVEDNGSLVEIGPRFVLDPIKIFKGSFQAQVLWDNRHYISPNLHRRMLKKTAANKFKSQVEQKLTRGLQRLGPSYKLDPLQDVFKGPGPEPEKRIKFVKPRPYTKAGGMAANGKTNLKPDAAKKRMNKPGQSARIKAKKRMRKGKRAGTNV